MEINISDLIFSTINFLIMVAILKLILYKPLQKVFHNRKQLIDGIRKEAEDNVVQSQKELEDVMQLRQQIEEQEKEIIEAAKLKVEEHSIKLIAEAEEEREELLARAEKEIQKAEKNFERDFMKQVVLLSEQFCKVIFGKNISSTEMDLLTDKIIEDINDFVTVDSNSFIIVTTAYPLLQYQRSNLLEKIEQLTGVNVMLEERIDPSMLGGMRLEIDDYIMDGSISANISKLRDNLLSYGDI